MKTKLLAAILLIAFAIPLQASNNFPFEVISQLDAEKALKLAKEYHHQNITVRGFLFKIDEGQWILSAEPNVKTCCIGSQKKITKQIYLSPDFEGVKTQNIVTLEGLLSVNVTSSHPPLFVLSNIKLNQ